MSAAIEEAIQRHNEGRSNSLGGDDDLAHDTASSPALSPQPSPPQDRRLSTDEWDAAKTKPSAFQKRKGSIYSTPSSRDGHIDLNYGRDAAFHKKHTEKGYGK
ncbi:hypothetical protein F5884DRAFT_385609 [Xylogone sp. PMI_703]|nr:hypothetical protein F5884DRAFT_385609 [Xylogone sp. PMI_703]